MAIHSGLSNDAVQPAVGLVGPVDVGPIAHGGHCVARLDGRVIFVRHALPGERVMVAITDTSHARFWRGDAVEILTASPGRVPEPCPIARQCGGCDFQHVGLTAQRELKRQVVAEQLRRLAGFEWDGQIEPLPSDACDSDLKQLGNYRLGLGYRTRMRYLVSGGRVGLRAFRSDRLVELPAQGCPIACPNPNADELRGWAEQIGEGELVVATTTDSVSVLSGSQVLTGRSVVSEECAGRRYRVRADGFWQVHTGAADTLVKALVEMLAPQPGESALDLYCGVGTFAGALADAGCRPVVGIEANAAAVRLAVTNVPAARFVTARLERAGRRLPEQVDLIVLDPPRSGAGRAVLTKLASLRPRAMCYIACDPVALARDLRTAGELGYYPRQVRGLDLFPMTHHVEVMVVLSRAGK